MRLGWIANPFDLIFVDGTPFRNDFTRDMTTVFNGASNIVQSGSTLEENLFSQFCDVS